ncbi:hypothetical protein GCM10025867_16690 [Frondihabitans sucicola]|uniref:Uncharacterized protein n=1 Tax=Frondihabitans sucicola TaxID=1268041 RepID=A0ABM8GM31_9MICO|nr:hypothetical protein [Frondihabitans sucicola]BDZ49428.1 hypothetical protein GCM10025867_16690 [Frondihabitans sucicola]
MTESRSDGTMWHFSQSVHADEAQGHFSELLRNVASTVDELGNVQVYDMTFKHEITTDDEYLTVTIYYDKIDAPNLSVIRTDRFRTEPNT